MRSQIIQHWEAKDDPEHLPTIRDRLLFNEHRAGRLLGLYQRVLQAQEVGEQACRERSRTGAGGRGQRKDKLYTSLSDLL